MVSDVQSHHAQDAVKGSAPDEVSLLDIVIILARHKRFILAFTMASAVLASIVAFLLPNQYIAETLILPPAQNSSSGMALLNQLGGGALASVAGGSLGIKNPADMYVSLFKSRTVEDAVIQRFGLMVRYKDKRMVDARKSLESHIAIALGAKDGLIRISVRDRDPKMAANIANGYVEEFHKLTDSLALTEAGQRRRFFEQQLLDAKNKLTNAEIEMKNTEQATGVLQIDSQAKALIESAANLRAQITAKHVQIQGMRSYATEDNPELALAQNQLEALQSQLSKLGGAQNDSPTDMVIPKGQITEAGMQYIRKYRDVKYYETIYELIARQYEVAKLDEARQGAVIQVADPAIPPDRKSSPHRAIIILLTAFAAMAVSMLFVLVLEGFDRARRAPAQDQKLRLIHDLLWVKR